MISRETRLLALLFRSRNYIRHHAGCPAERPWPAKGQRCTCGAVELYEQIGLVKAEQFLQQHAERAAGRRPS